METEFTIRIPLSLLNSLKEILNNATETVEEFDKAAVLAQLAEIKRTANGIRSQAEEASSAASDLEEKANDVQSAAGEIEESCDEVSDAVQSLIDSLKD